MPSLKSHIITYEYEGLKIWKQSQCEIFDDSHYKEF